MSTSRPIKVGLLKESELEEAGRIVRLAFGTFLGLPDPLDFMRDRNLMTPRWRSTHVKVIAAREGGRLIGSNVVTRWGSFGFFGPVTVLPEYWDRGVAQRLLESTMTIFDRWCVRHTGLFTFPQSAKHVGLYQKFGYWPRYLTAIMTRTLKADSALQANPANAPALLSAFTKSQCQEGKVEHGVKKRRSGGSVLRSPDPARLTVQRCPEFYKLLWQRGQPVFYAFDLLWLDGEDLPAKPLIERKRMLKRLLPPPPSSPILYAQHVERTGIEFYRLACDRDLESVVAKLKRRRIRPGLVQDSGTRAIRRTKPA